MLALALLLGAALLVAVESARNPTEQATQVELFAIREDLGTMSGPSPSMLDSSRSLAASLPRTSVLKGFSPGNFGSFGFQSVSQAELRTPLFFGDEAPAGYVHDSSNDTSNATYKASSDETEQFLLNTVLSLSLVLAICIVLALLIMLTCSGFCAGRGCCNSCGSRRATQKYSKRQVWCERIAIALFFAAMVVCAVLNLMASSELSRAIDRSFEQSDGLVDYLYGAVAPPVLSAASTIQSRAIPSVLTLQSTILDALPSHSEIGQYKACVGQSFVLIGIQRNVSQVLHQLNHSLYETAPDLNGVAGQIGELQAAILMLPNLNTLESNLRDLNASFGLLPSGEEVTEDMTTMLETIQELRVADEVLMVAEDLYLVSQAMPYEDARLSLQQMDAGFAALPDLDEVALHVEAAPATPAAVLIDDINNIDAAIGLFPDGDALVAMTELVHESVESVRSMAGVDARVRSVYESALNLTDTTRMQDHFLAIQQVVDDMNLAVLLDAVTATNTSLSALPSLSALADTLNRMNQTVSEVRAIDIDLLLDDLEAFNQSLTLLDCIDPLFDRLTLINTTVVILPDELSEIFDLKVKLDAQLDELGDLSHKINTGRDALLELNATLDSLPDFDDIQDKLTRANQSLNDLPDLTEVADKLRALNDSLHSMPRFDESWPR